LLKERCSGDEYAIRARLRRRATENAAVVQALIENLIERGSAFSVGTVAARLQNMTAGLGIMDRRAGFEGSARRLP
jgi:hypothetical protein